MRRLHILLVDSDPYAQDKIRYTLGKEFTVQCIGSVTEAKACLTAWLPDILISEVSVGQESGLDLCRFVRSDPTHHHLPIMLLTSLATLQDKIAGFEAGADDYVVKPFDVPHLKVRIRLLLRIKRLERDQNQ